MGIKDRIMVVVVGVVFVAAVLVVILVWQGRKTAKLTTTTMQMELALILNGEFMMGSPAGEANRRNHELLHRVVIAGPFLLGAHEVTVGQFASFVRETGYETEAERDGKGGTGWDETKGTFEGPDPKYTWRNPGFDQTEDHPVVNVSWNDAVAFCDWLTEKEGHRYRLPTEAEREYACRAGTTTAYQHGDDPEGLRSMGNVGKAIDGPFTAPVGQSRANALGLFDMHGNVREWCSDWYGEGYYVESPELDPQGPAEGSHRVLRGGSWFGLHDWRSASRDFNLQSRPSCFDGFRFASTLFPSK